MRKTPIALTALALSAGVACAADNPIATRKALMDSNAAAAGMAGAMLKEDMPYNPAAGKSAIATMRAVALAYGAFFPDSSKTRRHPCVAEDLDGSRGIREGARPSSRPIRKRR